jgi:polysaccharide biosynthesis protein PslH
MKVLFVKQHLAFPRVSGLDVFCYELLRGMGSLGHTVTLVTEQPVEHPSYRDLRVETIGARAKGTTSGRGMRDRFASYWGVDANVIAAIADRAESHDAVVAVGLKSLPYFNAFGPTGRGPIRVWLAGDEWARHHLSLLRFGDRSTWHHLRLAAVEGLYERTYANVVDRVWAVSHGEARAFRRVMRHPRVDVVPVGVDAEHYAPSVVARRPNSCVFWGRLDFEPNDDAMRWFVAEVWPQVRENTPDALLTIAGFGATPPLQRIASRAEGVDLFGGCDDIRELIATHEVAVVPMRTGHGAKNKVLEAAASGIPILSTPRGMQGFDAHSAHVAQAQPHLWSAALHRLWRNPELRGQLAERARRQVIENHSWTQTARIALDSLGAANARSNDALAPQGNCGE